MKEPISEVRNCDCVAFMKTLPDKYFEIALCDPPYGDPLGGAADRFGQRFDRYKPQIFPPQQQFANRSRFNGSNFKRYRPIVQRQEDAQPFSSSRTNNENNNVECGENKPTKIHTSGGRTQKYYPTVGNDEENAKPKHGEIAWDIAPPQEYWDELFRISKNQIIWGGNYFSLPPTRCFIVWRKLSISENFSMAMAEYAWTSFNDNAKVYEAVPQRGKTAAKFHPTEKSIDLYMWTLKRFAHEGDKIFDSHMGSQNSRIAAYNLGLDYWGCEIDKQYFEKGCAHFEEICHGVKKLKDGRTLKELSIFDFEE